MLKNREEAAEDRDRRVTAVQMLYLHTALFLPGF
jgi:hypothetical protein